MPQPTKQRLLVQAARAAIAVRAADDQLMSAVRAANATGATLREIESATAMPLEIIEHILLERADA